MRKFFTLTLTSKLFLFLCLVFVATISVKAEEYKSMIRYDRVWEHIAVHWTHNTVYYAKFDGAEEINGKTYHRLVSFRRSDFNYDEEGKPYVFDVDENYLQHEGYLREEDGKVYTLITDVKRSDYGLHGHLYMPNGSDAHPADLEEMLIYDFTCKEGESYRGLVTNGYYVDEITYKVKSTEFIEIDGEQHHRLLVSPEESEWLELPMVEGVGIASEYGCLTTINTDMPTCPCMDHIFSRVLDMYGKEIYREDEDPSRIPIDFLGVGSIAEQVGEAAPIYDLYGRRISAPVPGQLYIQGGKKYIGK
ncbi:MAG: hypothetical protein K2L45_11500 [Muribaculaceae bacterium]|nr:hypothetical protein [Muribaculaceae bacterium]MDE6632537.1 hypothetical protein [Muribaculaceae bacterium]